MAEVMRLREQVEAQQKPVSAPIETPIETPIENPLVCTPRRTQASKDAPKDALVSPVIAGPTFQPRGKGLPKKLTQIESPKHYHLATASSTQI